MLSMLFSEMGDGFNGLLSAEVFLTRCDAMRDKDSKNMRPQNVFKMF